MAYKMTKQGTTNEFICETANDLTNIPKDQINFGAAAIIMENAQIYMANSKKEWVPFGAGTSNSSNSSASSPTADQGQADSMVLQE